MNLLLHIIHCIVEVRKHLEKLHPTALLRGESPRAGSPGLWHLGFGCFQACRLHHLSRKPVPLLSHPHSNFPPFFVWTDFLVFLIVPIAFCPIPRYHWAEPVSIFFPSPFQVLTFITKIPLILLLSRLKSPSFLSLTHRREAQSPSLIFMDLCCTHSSSSMSLLFWGAQNWSQNFSYGSPVLSRKEGTLILLAAPCLIQLRRVVAFCHNTAGWCLSCCLFNVFYSLIQCYTDVAVFSSIWILRIWDLCQWKFFSLV